ncbi:MAG TPA: VWA domain-containing protein [Vicinamibacterales bacterium]|nr:VWA domain-containing protein [Vicinamibacterales bacterium]
MASLALALHAQQAKPQTPPPDQQPPQTPPPRPVFRAGVDLIQVDVVVLDAEGRPVHGLKKEDFTLVDKGKPRDVATFAEQANHHRPEPLLPMDVPLDVANNQTAASDRLIVLVLDDLHFRGRSEEAKALVHQVVEEIGAGATLSLVTTSRLFDVEPTEDRVRLLQAVDRFVDRFDPGRAGSAGSVSGRGPGDLAGAFSTWSTYRFTGNVAKMIGADDGRRKAFVWISAGVPDAGLAPYVQHAPSGILDPCEGAAWSCTEIAGMLDKFRRSSVTVYGVSPGGPTDGGSSLGAIAKLTGGFAVPANDLEAGMNRLLTDLDNYYILGFYPDVPIDRKYHEIEVLVNRPGVTVRYRAGYQPGGPPAPPKNDTMLGTLVGPVMPRTDLPLRLHAVPFFTSRSSVDLVTTLEIDLDKFPPARADGQIDDTFEFGLFAVDLKKKKVTRSAGRRVEVAWPIENGRPSGAPPFRVQSVLTLPPGPYQIRASATAKAIDRTGSVYLLIDVPTTDHVPLLVSGLAVTSRQAERRDPRLVYAKPLTGLSLPFAPTLSRVFQSTDELRVFFQVHRQNAATPVTGGASLMDEAGAAHASIAWRLDSLRESSVELRLPLSDVATGPYHLLVTATDGTHQAWRNVGIRVERDR